VRLSTDSGAHWSVLGSTAGSPVSITGLTNGTSYVFSVAAVNGVGTGTFSANSATVMPAGAPSVPTGVSATAADQQATVSWIAPANGGSAITSYDVRYSTNGGTSWTSAGIAYGGSPALLTGLTNGASYLFEVAAINDIGTSSYSAPSAAVMPAAAPDAVTDLTASRDNAKATLSWTEPAANGAPIKSYVVEYTTDNAVHWTTVTGSFTGSPVTVGGLTNGTSYTFAVAAVNAAGTGAFSNVSNAVVPATTPAAPTGVSAVAGDSQVTVSWLVPADDGGVAISSYDVRYSADGGTTWTSSGVVATGSPATVTGLTNGTSYVFDVAALNDVGLGNYSAPSGAAKPWRDSSSLSGGPSTTIAYGNSLVLSTVLRDSTTGSALVSYSVQLMSRTSTSKPWTAYRTVSTSSTGAASATVKPTALTMYSWQFAGTPGHAATTSSAQTVSVAQVVGIAATATSIRHGNVVKYYGTVGPNQAGQYVYLQILVGRTWKTTALKAKLISQRLPNGHTMVGYVLALKTASIGTFSYRAYRPATSVNVLAASKAMALKVT
jgi:titin